MKVKVCLTRNMQYEKSFDTTTLRNDNKVPLIKCVLWDLTAVSSPQLRANRHVPEACPDLRLPAGLPWSALHPGSPLLRLPCEVWLVRVPDLHPVNGQVLREVRPECSPPLNMSPRRATFLHVVATSLSAQCFMKLVCCATWDTCPGTMSSVSGLHVNARVREGATDPWWTRVKRDGLGRTTGGVNKKTIKVKGWFHVSLISSWTNRWTVTRWQLFTSLWGKWTWEHRLVANRKTVRLESGWVENLCFVLF